MVATPRPTHWFSESQFLPTPSLHLTCHLLVRILIVDLPKERAGMAWEGKSNLPFPDGSSMYRAVVSLP
jgi:hypothetical protein